MNIVLSNSDNLKHSKLKFQTADWINEPIIINYVNIFNFCFNTEKCGNIEANIMYRNRINQRRRVNPMLPINLSPVYFPLKC